MLSDEDTRSNDNLDHKQDPSDPLVSCEQRTVVKTQSDLAISGWIATLLGFYLFATGSFNLYRLIEKTDSAPEILGVVPELLGTTSPVASDKLSIMVLLSYVAGLPMFAGSALMGLGSLARSAKRSSTEKRYEVVLSSDEWIFKCSTTHELFQGILDFLQRRGLDITRISLKRSVIYGEKAIIRDENGSYIATFSKDWQTGYWRMAGIAK
jgi:hypothetical protein